MLAPATPSTAGARAPAAIPLEIPSGYAKREPVVDVRVLFIISGGEKREKDYFTVLMKNHSSSVRIAFCTQEGNGYHPREMVEKAKEFLCRKLFIIEKKNEKPTELPMEDGDIVYLLQDMDYFETEIQKLNNAGMPAGARWVISNPAFEIWLYYHYYCSPKGRLDELEGLDVCQRSKRLKQILDNLGTHDSGGGIDPRKAFYEMRTAINNSEANWRTVNGLPALYATQMPIVAKEILRLLGEDNFDKLKASKEEETRMWKNKTI